MRSDRRASGAVLAIVASGLVALTVGAAAAGGGAPKPLTIGAVFSLTGGGDVYGPQQLKAAKLAVAQTNAAGGIEGAPLRLVALDDHSLPADGVADMRQLITKDGVLAVLGPSLSLVAISADPVADKLETPVVAVSNTANGIVGHCAYPCTWIWRDSLGESVAVPANIRAYVVDHHPSTAAVLFTSGDLLGTDEAQIARQSLAANNVRVVAKRSMPQTGSTEAIVRGLLALKPDVLFIGSTFGAEVAQVIKEARAHGFTGAVLGGNTMNSATTTKLAGAAGKGAQSGAAWYPGNDFPANASFITAYTQAYAEPPDQFAAQAFVGVQILVSALTHAKVATSDGSVAAKRAQVQQALAGVALTTALGPFRFTPDHDVSQIVWILAMNGQGGHTLAGFCAPGC